MIRGFRVKARKALKSQFSEEPAAVNVSHTEQQLKILCTRVAWLEPSGIRIEGSRQDVLDLCALAVNSKAPA